MSVGELFKILGNNTIFLNCIINGHKNNKTNQDIIEDAIDCEELMNDLTILVPDIQIICDKMNIIIGQKRKNMKVVVNEEKEEKEVNEEVKVNEEKEVNEEVIDLFANMKHKPINKDKVVWLWKTCYTEQIDHRIRLVNGDIEMYY
jgi:hypothetical protein